MLSHGYRRCAPRHPACHPDRKKIDYVVITSEELKPSFVPLISWKLAKGLKSKIITTEEIDSKYQESRDSSGSRNVCMTFIRTTLCGTLCSAVMTLWLQRVDVLLS